MHSVITAKYFYCQDLLCSRNSAKNRIIHCIQAAKWIKTESCFECLCMKKRQKSGQMSSCFTVPHQHCPLTFCLSLFSLCPATLREEDKNIFDYCRENNIDRVGEAISSQKVDVNTKDEEVPMKPESRDVSRSAAESRPQERKWSTVKVSVKTLGREGGRAEHYFNEQQKVDVAYKRLTSPEGQVTDWIDRKLSGSPENRPGPPAETPADLRVL